jgi:hypothetical protein
MKVYLSENLKRRDNSEDLGVGGRILLEWTLEKYGGNLWTGCTSLRTDPVAVFCEHGTEHSYSVIGGVFLTGRVVIIFFFCSMELFIEIYMG